MSKKSRHVTHITHHKFLAELSSSTNGKPSKRFRKLSFNKTVGVAVGDTYNVPLYKKEVFLEPAMKINPEALAFLFYVGGCSKNLLLFLLVQKHDSHTGRYSFNASVVDEFQEFSLKYFSVKYSESTIRQAHRSLVLANVTLNVKMGTYFINPLLSGGSNSSGRRKLINDYSMLLLKKGKMPDVDIYPIFKCQGVTKNTKQVVKISELK